MPRISSLPPIRDGEDQETRPVSGGIGAIKQVEFNILISQKPDSMISGFCLLDNYYLILAII